MELDKREFVQHCELDDGRIVTTYNIWCDHLRVPSWHHIVVVQDEEDGEERIVVYRKHAQSWVRNYLFMAEVNADMDNLFPYYPELPPVVTKFNGPNERLKITLANVTFAFSVALTGDVVEYHVNEGVETLDAAIELAKALRVHKSSVREMVRARYAALKHSDDWNLVVAKRIINGLIERL